MSKWYQAKKDIVKAISIIALLATTAGTTDVLAKSDISEESYTTMKWRNIGPFRGGRALAVAGVVGDDQTYYMGGAGSGVWKTESSGRKWKNISDGFFNTASIGAIAVAKSDPNVIYVGTGEGPVRGVATTHGDGVYKSTDAGKTWTNVGLKETRHIGQIVVHPTNPDLVYVAAQGGLWGPNKERGVFRSTDGGKTWEKKLFVNDETGSNNISMDATNPRILYATMWEHGRKPWYVKSGGKGSGIYKSTDSGDTWEKLTTGLPEEMGKIGITVSPVNPERVFAVVEADYDKRGLYRSDNGGKEWSLINQDHKIHTRSWYYMHIFADSQNEDTLYILNGPYTKSIDGGKTFKTLPTPHGDNHDLWINPENSKNMINANDGGANVTHNGGKTWSIQSNQPTAQFYRVITDNKFPYRIYGSQQDNSTVSIPSQTDTSGITIDTWHSIGGGESAHIGMDPNDPTLIYASNIAGFVTQYNNDTKRLRSIRPYPEMTFAVEPKTLRYRFNWTAPLIVSPHNPAVIYYGAQKVLKSTDQGISWQEISGDLTRNRKDQQGQGGGPFTNEQVSAENYNTLFYLAESPVTEGVLWAGSDDGLVHLSQDGGTTWTNVTPKGLPEAQINTIEASPFEAGTAYISVTGYKLNDFKPYIYKTENYGKSWRKLVKGIPEDTFVRAVREDPNRKGLLYAATETGVFISFDDGKEWQSLQLNLPEVPVTDLTIRQNDLIAATQGRAFWILDNLTPLQQLSKETIKADFALFQPRNSYFRFSSDSFFAYDEKGQNPKKGVTIAYHLLKERKDTDAAITLEILDSKDQVVRHFSSAGDPVCVKKDTKKKPPVLSADKGLNLWVWDHSRKPYECNKTLLHTRPDFSGHRVAPGQYKARLTVDGASQTQSFQIIPDPRLNIASSDFANYDQIVTDLSGSVQDMLSKVTTIKKVIKQVAISGKLITSDDLKAKNTAFEKNLDDWKEMIVNSNLQTFQDVVSFDSQLAFTVLTLLDEVDSDQIPVTKGAQEYSATLLKEWQSVNGIYQSLKADDLKAYNQAMQKAGLPQIYWP